MDVLRIDGQPVFRLGTEVYRERQALAQALAFLHLPSGLFVRGADDVPVSFVAAAIQAGRDAGFDQVTYVPAN